MPNELVKFVSVNGIPQDAEKLVATLEQCGGSIKRLLADCPAEQHEYLLSLAEQLLHDSENKRLQRRWNEAIRRNSVARLRLLQDRSLERLESLSVAADEETKADWLAMAKEAAAHKMLCGDLLAAQIHHVKQKQEHLPDQAEIDADAADAAEADEAMEI